MGVEVARASLVAGAGCAAVGKAPGLSARYVVGGTGWQGLLPERAFEERPTRRGPRRYRRRNHRRVLHLGRRQGAGQMRRGRDEGRLGWWEPARLVVQAPRIILGKKWR